ncbi:hypothetical protein D3C71_1504860 [compost metagenome]
MRCGNHPFALAVDHAPAPLVLDAGPVILEFLDAVVVGFQRRRALADVPDAPAALAVLVLRAVEQQFAVEF